MSKKLFVGNLNWKASTDELRQLFEQQGAVEDAKVITDRDTGRSRGFGFVTMASDDDANKAIAALNNQDFQGRPLKVNEATERPRTFSKSAGPRQ